MLLWLLACSHPEEPPLPESEGRPSFPAPLELLESELIEPAVQAGDRFAWVRRGTPSILEVQERGEDVRVVMDQHNPDRVALSPDGQTIAWVASPQGLPSVHVADWDTLEPIALTNVNLPPGSPPPGFVPPPLTTLAFDGDQLVWESQDGPQSVALP